MALVADGGGGGFSPSFNVAKAVGNVAKKATQSARKTQKRNNTIKRSVNNVARAATNSANNTARRNRSSGSSGGSRSAGSGSGYRAPSRPTVSRPPTGSTPGGAIVPTVPAPVVPKFNDAYLAGDTAWMQQKDAYDKALRDFNLRSTGQLQNYGTEYNTKLQDMQKAQDQGALDLKDDYAARGLLESGVYANALNDFNNTYTSQRDELARAKQQYETDMANQKTDFSSEQNLLLQKAKQDALNRYNDKYQK